MFVVDLNKPNQTRDGQGRLVRLTLTPRKPPNMAKNGSNYGENEGNRIP